MHDGQGDREMVTAALKLAVVTHLAYDAPHKTAARAVMGLARDLLREAGLSIQGWRSTLSCAWSLLAESLPSYSQRQWETLELDTPKSLRSYAVERLGLVWLPEQRLVLGRAAGRAAHAALVAASVQQRQAWRCFATTWPLLEIMMWLLHKTQQRHPTADIGAAVEVFRTALANCRAGRPVTTLGALYRSLLF